MLKPTSETDFKDWKRKIEITLFIQSAFASGSRLMGIICIHLMIYFLECIRYIPKWQNDTDVRQIRTDQIRSDRNMVR